MSEDNSFEIQALQESVTSLRRLVNSKIISVQNKALSKGKADNEIEPIIIKEGRNLRPINKLAHSSFEQVMTLAMTNLPIMLVGPAGSGKTSICSLMAEALKLPFVSITMTADSPASIFKGRRPLGDFLTTPFIECYENGGVVLIDEIDSADPNVLLSINTALAGDELDLPLRFEAPMAKRHPKFYCISAANTFGAGADRQYVGRNQLDAAFLDRFLVIEVDYDRNIEKSMGHPAIVELVHFIRHYVQKNKWRRIVSSRMITKIQAVMDQYPATTREQATEFILTSWPQLEREQVVREITISKFFNKWPNLIAVTTAEELPF